MQQEVRLTSSSILEMIIHFVDPQCLSNILFPPQCPNPLVVEDCVHVGPHVIGAISFENDDETISVGSSNTSLGDGREREIETPESDRIRVTAI